MTSISPGELAAIDARHALTRDQLDSLIDMVRSFTNLGVDVPDPRVVEAVGKFITPDDSGHPTRGELAAVVALAAIRLAGEVS